MTTDINEYNLIRLQQRAAREGCSVDELLTRLLDDPQPQSNIPYELIIEHISDDITLFDMDLRYVYISPGIEATTGLKLSEIAGKKPAEVDLPEHNLRDWHKTWQRVIETGQEEIIYFEYASQTGVMNIEARFRPIYVGNKPVYLLAVTRDVTERAQSQDMLRDITNRLPGMILSYRLYPDGTDSVPYVSAGIEKIYEVSVEDALEDINRVWAKIHPDDLTDFAASIQQSAENLSHWDYQWRIQMNDGTIKCVAGMGTPRRLDDGSTLWNTLILDITERKRSEKQVRQLNERFATLFHSSPGQLTLVHADTGKLIEYNSAFLNAFGYTVEDLTAPEFNVREIWVNEADRDAFTHQLRENGSIENTTLRFKTKSGDVRDFFGSVTLLEIDGDDYILATLTDLTDYKRLEKQAQQAQILQVELAKEKELVVLRDRLISVISHEFRTPLAVIQSSSQILERYMERITPQKRADLYQQIRQQISMLTNMTDSMLAITRTRAGKTGFNPQQLEISQYLRELFERVKHIDTGNHHFLFNDNMIDMVIPVDTALLNHILMNLLSNAIKYSPPHTTITLDLSTSNDYIILKVQDEGIGIPESDQAHLFEPFHRASNVGEVRGTGMGLSIVKEYVQLHGGIISVNSHPDTGSTFTVKLPAY